MRSRLLLKCRVKDWEAIHTWLTADSWIKLLYKFILIHTAGKRTKLESAEIRDNGRWTHADAEHIIEVLTTDDAKIKSIGEAFATDTSRQIWIKIFEGVNSTGDIAAKLNLSIPLVSYHLKRLEQIGLIKVGYTEFSSKQQKVNRYVPAKFAFVLIPSTVVKDQSYKGILRRALHVLNGKLLVPLVFCSTLTGSYIAAKIGINQLYRQSGTGMEISVGSDFVLSFDNFISFLIANPDLFLAIGVSIVTSYFVWRKYRKFKTVQVE